MLNKKILLADDDIEYSKLCLIYLKRLPQFVNVVFFTATTKKEAEECFLAEKPDIFILDIDLDDAHGGIDVLMNVRPKVPASKIIVVSGYDEFQERVLFLGADGFIRKGTQKLSDFGVFLEKFLHSK